MEERSTPAAAHLGLNADDCARLTGLYNGRLAELGDADVRTVGWGSRADQHLRFTVLCRGLKLSGGRILDVGCGLGDLVPWAETRWGRDFDYVGLDLSADLVAAAARRHGGPRRTFVTGTLGDTRFAFGDFDAVILSGTLTFRTSDNLATMRAMLGRAFACCRGTVCANFMSSYVDHQLSKNFHYAPENVFAFAKSLTPWVSLFHDYPLYEFTVQLHRQPTLPREIPS